MLRCLLVFCTVASGASLTISPAVIHSCSGFLGEAEITWSGASGTVYIGVGPGRAPLTGPEPPSGVAIVPPWITDGMQFFLINTSGEVEAVATARVKCGGEEASGSYFPLAVGNTWVYRLDSRNVTSSYVIQKVTGTRLIGGRVWFVVTSGASETLLREDDLGRILQWTDGAESVYLNPAQWPRRTYKSALDDFPHAIFQMGEFGLGTTDRWFARGIGMVNERSRLNTGSSGGFTSGLELIEVRLAGGVHLELPAASLTLAAESRRLDVSGRNVTNCAIPCYFVACGIAGADPPGTWKPCTQARVKASAAGDFLTELELVNASSQVVFRAETLPAQGESVRYVQLPLYSAPNVPLPTGEYRLVGRLRSGGDEAASAVMTLFIE